MNREEIKKILPHREPMLLVDEVTTDENGGSRGRYTVRGDEFFLQGHFPGSPVVPGVILCEIIAQCACLLLGEGDSGVTPYFTGLSDVKFRRMVKPGDTIEVSCNLKRRIRNIIMAAGVAKVDNQVACEAEFSFALVKSEDGAH